MQSLKRKTMLWEDAKRSAELERQRAAAARTGQVARSTVDVYGEPTQLDQMLEEASDTAALTSEQEDAIFVLDEDQANGLDQFLDGDGTDIDDLLDAGELGMENTESDADRWAEYDDSVVDAHESGMDAIDAWGKSAFATELAKQLETDLAAAKVELDQALTEAQAALTEAGLARSEAAQAVADADAAAVAAAKAVQDALAAAQLAEGAAPSWSTVDPVAGDAEGKPAGAIWYVRDTAGRVVRMWELTALGWVNRPFDESVIPQVSIGAGTYGTLAGDRLVAKSVTAAQIEALAITASELAASAVTAVKIAADAVTAEKINAGAVTTDKLYALAVTAEKLAVGAVVADKIAAGAVSAEKISADFYYGREFYGGKFTGGEFTLPTVASQEALLVDGCEVVGDWVRPDTTYTNPTRSSAQKHAGTYSLVPGRTTDNIALMRRPVGPFSFPRGGRISVWVWRSSRGIVRIGASNSDIYTPTTIEGGVWVEISRDIPEGSTVSWISVGGLMDAANDVLYVDDVSIIRYTQLAGKAAIGRRADGEARIYSEDAREDSISMQGSSLVGKYGPFHSFRGGVDGGGLGLTAVRDEIGHTTPGGRTRSLELTVSSVSGTIGYRDGYEGSAALSSAALVFGVGDTITVVGNLKYFDDTDWANVSVPGATGTCRWRRMAGMIYLQYNVTFTAELAAGAAKAPAFTLPAAARPPEDWPITVLGAGTRPAGGYIEASTGAAAIRNIHTSGLSRFFGSGAWPAT